MRTEISNEGFYKALPHSVRCKAFPGGSAVKNPSEMQEIQEIWVQSLGQEDPLEEEMATHSSSHAEEIPGTEEPGGLQSWGHKESDTTE